MSDEYEHIWVSNGGLGGEPIFHPHSMFGGDIVMHVKCDECNCRTWFNKERWESFEETPETTDAD